MTYSRRSGRDLIQRRFRARAAFGMSCLWLAAALVDVSRADDPGAITQEFLRFRDAIVAANKANRAKLPRTCHLVWRRETSEHGFLPGREIDANGEYELWTKDGKVATRSMEDKIFEDQHKERHGQRTALNGLDARAVPNVPKPKAIAIKSKADYRVHANESWFDVVGWNQPLSIVDLSSRTELGFSLDSWGIDDADGKHVAHVTFRGEDGEGMVPGIVLHYYYNLDCGSGCERNEQYAAEGHLQRDMRCRFAEVSPGFWFPVELTGRAFDAQGKETMMNHFELDMKSCVFGDDSAVPDDIFELPITPDMKVVDYRAGGRVKYSGRTSPMDMVELTSLAHEFAGYPLPRPLAALYVYWKWVALFAGLLLMFVAWYTRVLRRRRVGRVGTT